MADRKLTVEIDADETKAKRKLEGLGGEVSAGALANTDLSRSSRAIRKFADATESASVSTSRLVRSFSGLAIGMAATYAKTHMAEGIARTSIGYAGSMLAGASMGAMVGGAPGAAIGAGLGAAKEWIDNDAAQTAAIKDFDKAEKTYQENLEWEEHFKRLTKSADETRIAIARLKHEEKQLVVEIKQHLNAGELEAAQEKQAELARTRQRTAQLEREAKKQPKDIFAGIKSDDYVAATNGLNALGGEFVQAQANTYSMQQLAVERDMLQELKKLNQSMPGFGSTFT